MGSSGSGSVSCGLLWMLAGILRSLFCFELWLEFGGWKMSDLES